VNISKFQFQQKAQEQLLKSSQEQEKREEDAHGSLVLESQRRARLLSVQNSKEMERVPQLMLDKAKLAEAKRQEKVDEADGIQTQKLEYLKAGIQAEAKRQQEQLEARKEAAKSEQEAWHQRAQESAEKWEVKVGELKGELKTLAEEEDEASKRYLAEQKDMEEELSGKVQGVKTKVDAAALDEAQKAVFYLDSELKEMKGKMMEEQELEKQAEGQLRYAKEHPEKKKATFEQRLAAVPHDGKKALELDRSTAKVTLASMKKEEEEAQAKQTADVDALKKQVDEYQKAFEKGESDAEEQLLKDQMPLIKEVKARKEELSKIRDYLDKEPTVAERVKEKISDLVIHRTSFPDTLDGGLW